MVLHNKRKSKQRKNVNLWLGWNISVHKNETSSRFKLLVIGRQQVPGSLAFLPNRDIFFYLHIQVLIFTFIFCILKDVLVFNLFPLSSP